MAAVEHISVAQRRRAIDHFTHGYDNTESGYQEMMAGLVEILDTRAWLDDDTFSVPENVDDPQTILVTYATHLRPIATNTAQRLSRFAALYQVMGGTAKVLATENEMKALAPVLKEHLDDPARMTEVYNEVLDVAGTIAADDGRPRGAKHVKLAIKKTGNVSPRMKAALVGRRYSERDASADLKAAIAALNRIMAWSDEGKATEYLTRFNNWFEAQLQESGFSA